uniref:J domain-containing protein n=1 Tax=Psychrobacter sp. TaxID=56811 RepID=UPI0025D270D6
MTESCWDILGIEATNDERVIKKAYALKLRDNKPDKNPTGFKALRDAYEQALNERFWLDFYDDNDPEVDTQDEEEDEQVLEPYESKTSPTVTPYLSIDDSPIDESLDAVYLEGNQYSEG